MIQGDNMEAGPIYSSSSNPVSRYIEFLLGKKDKIENFGELVAPINVKYIILTKEVDYEKYDFLNKQKDLELIMDTENLVVFRNLHPVSRLYQVDGVITIKNFDDLLDISKTRDITSFAILTGNETKLQDSNGQPLNYTFVSPVNYILDRPSKKYVIYSQRYSGSWKLDGKAPFANFGVTNAYDTSDIKGNLLYYEMFNTYLAGYIISGFAFIFLIILYFKENLRTRMGI